MTAVVENVTSVNEYVMQSFKYFKLFLANLVQPLFTYHYYFMVIRIISRWINHDFGDSRGGV